MALLTRSTRHQTTSASSLAAMQRELPDRDSIRRRAIAAFARSHRTEPDERTERPPGRRPAKPGAPAGSPAGPTGPGDARRAPTEDEIRHRAHAIYLDRVRAGRPGTAESDWLQAERELKSESGIG